MRLPEQQRNSDFHISNQTRLYWGGHKKSFTPNKSLKICALSDTHPNFADLDKLQLVLSAFSNWKY